MSVYKVLKRNPVVFPLACLAVLAIVAVSETSYWRSSAKLNTLTQFGAARTAVQDLAQAILDAEASQRSYLVTHRDEYLRPYEQALKQIDHSFRFLDQYYQKDENSTAVLSKLHTVVEGKLSELSETLRLQREGKNDAAMALMLSDIGREKMDAVRQLTQELFARESANVAAGREEVTQTLWLARLGVMVLSVLGLLSLFMYLRQTSRLEAQREEQQRLVQGERDRLEEEVAQRTAQLVELTDHLQTAREDERNRLARNLHDELGALLTSAKLDAARIRSRLAGAAPEALDRLNHLVETLNSSIALGRRIIEDLRPSTLSNLGLVPTLEILGRDFASHSGVQVHSQLEAVKLPSDAQLVVYRLVQEAITNITKHARARQVWISLQARDGQAHVSVRDDGVGFDLAQQPRSSFGLIGMRYRVAAEGGEFKLSSAPGEGTCVEAVLPETETAPA
ncbi:CHASE3 domain-containing protein [Piscinibacter sp. HJYY11]|uniref:CHASE3 domain-containing protein n=1 Tax=Piscinibacter sp. HJYY11 TaxID=2801333 RepID=UPI00191CB610|nr:CHASE3 domain-containing protein [Piscinibacter sp. HJYY11]MBL0730880.1 CHASE3 domain-containing protein [Piscinibacter sp. HJYY11]